MGQAASFCQCLPNLRALGRRCGSEDKGGNDSSSDSSTRCALVSPPKPLTMSTVDESQGCQEEKTPAPGEKVGHYRVLREMGSGHFGNVFIAKDERDGSPCALKLMEARTLREESLRGYDFRTEIAIHASMQHDNIIRLRDFAIDEKWAIMVMDAACGGTLRDYIVREEYLDEDDARRLMRQLVPAIAYCHARSVCHRDIKPENILLTGFGELRLCDFGLAASVDVVGKRLRGKSGTKQYSAPEVLWAVDGGYDGAKADAFSVGIVLYVMVHGAIPYGRKRTADGTVQRDGELVFEDDVTEELRALLRGLMEPEPELRLTMKDVMVHPWYVGES